MAAGVEPLVVWINRAIGVGKTAVAAVADELARLLLHAVLFGPESLGVVLRAAVSAEEQTDDFRDVAAWRATTRAAVVSLARSRSGDVVVPMTLVSDRYCDEIGGGAWRDGVRLVHDVVAGRLATRSENEKWGLDRVDASVAEPAGDQFAEHVDAAVAAPPELAARIRDLVGAHVEGHS